MTLKTWRITIWSMLFSDCKRPAYKAKPPDQNFWLHIQARYYNIKLTEHQVYVQFRNFQGIGS